MNIFIKVLINHAIFLILHYAYDFFPNSFVALLSGINESMFQHMKIGFFSYGLASAIELTWLGRTKKISGVLFIRLFTTTLLPWIMMLIYYVPVAFFGEIDSYVLEIVIANTVLILTALQTVLLEQDFDRMNVSFKFKVLSSLVFVIAGFLFIFFTFQLPWFDVFAVPPGW